MSKKANNVVQLVVGNDIKVIYKAGFRLNTFIDKNPVIATKSAETQKELFASAQTQFSADTLNGGNVDSTGKPKLKKRDGQLREMVTLTVDTGEVDHTTVEGRELVQKFLAGEQAKHDANGEDLAKLIATYLPKESAGE